MRRLICCLIVLGLLIPQAALAAVRGRKAMYVGGTFQNIPQNAQGQLTFEEDKLVFKLEKGKDAITMPYKAVETIEYGQKAGRRLGVALVVSPLFLFSKKRKHYVTISFVDADGKKQGAVLELAKGIVSDTLKTLETKTGKKVEYESDEAKATAEKS